MPDTGLMRQDDSADSKRQSAAARPRGMRQSIGKHDICYVECMFALIIANRVVCKKVHRLVSFCVCLCHNL